MLIGGVILDYICVIWSYLIKNWDFARFFTTTVLVLIIVYATGNVTQKKLLNGGNGNGNGTEK